MSKTQSSGAAQVENEPLSLAFDMYVILLPFFAVQGIVQRRWVWLLLFSPLWGSLFINFGESKTVPLLHVIRVTRSSSRL